MFNLTDEQIEALIAILKVSGSEVLEPFLSELLRYQVLCEVLGDV